MLFFLGFIFNGQSQVIQLDETDVRFSPKIQLISTFSNGMVLKIEEDYAGEFSENPLMFMHENFNIQNFIKNLDKENYNYYVVDFKSRKGNLEAWFDSDGNLFETTQKFKNVALPRDIAIALVRDHNGWIMARNTYKAFGDGDGVTMEKYTIRLKNGNKSQTVRITPERDLGVASN